MKIVTLTLNPAFDVHLEVPAFREGKESLVESSSKDIGGKGINITRALLENGISNTALVALGDENALDFLRGMDVCGISERAVITVCGRIRENMTIHPSSGDETRISFKGFSSDASLLEKTLSFISSGNDTIVTFTGSLPSGISDNDTEAFLRRIKESGAKLVIDSKSVPLDMLKRLKPWLIKPNAEEICAYLGELDTDGIIRAAVSLHEDGIDNALISLGGDGSVLACGEGVFIARPPHIDAVSTIGAGDSMIAGFIAAANKPAAERLITASAYGTSACLREGTNPPLSSDIDRIAREISIRKVL